MTAPANGPLATTVEHTNGAASHGLSRVEFIALMALMMALTALSIDIMLPALPAIGEALGVGDPNDRQIIIISYVLGFSAGQLIYGRLSDRLGRKPVLLTGMAIFIAGSVVASLSTSFEVLLAARVLQGLGAAARASSPSPSCATSTSGGRWRASCRS